MNNLAKKLESLANIAIIIVAVLISVVLVKNYLLDKSNSFAQVVDNSHTPVGTKISLPDVDWAKNGQTLVLALSSTCHFCTESAPFYKRLAENKGNTRLIAVLPQPPPVATQYLNEIGVPISDVRQASLDSINVSGTPTLVLVDNKGVVINSWFGKLPDAKEVEVFNQLRASR